MGAALLGLVLVLAAAGAAVALLTPWRPLPGPIPGGRVQPSAARDFSVDELARERAFHRSVRQFTYAGTAASLVTILVLALTSAGAWLVDAVWPGSGGWWPARLLVGTVAVTGLLRLVTLPTSALARRVSVRFGISTQSWAAWLTDAARAWVLGVGLTFAGLLVLGVGARHWPQGWWLPGCVLAAAAVVVVSFLYPVLVEPVFNRFTPLGEGALRTDLLDLARQDGQPVRDVLVADASRRTTALNAYVSGLGSTRRVVVYDTLLERASPEEVRLVVAHELGHAARHDVRVGTALAALGAAAGVIVLYLVAGASWFRDRAGIGSEGAVDVRSIALVLATFAVIGLVSTPVQNLVSRRIEARADIHALDLTGDAATFVAMQRRLAIANLSELEPARVVYGLFATHPAPPERIASARSWARRRDRPA